jgi:hypothetical protein
MVLLIDEVIPDEPCLRLSEVYQLDENNSKLRRYQVTYVIRYDKPAKHMLDMGPYESFTTSEFHLPGAVKDEQTGHITIVHTVGELQDIANALRDQKQEEVLPRRDIWQDYFTQLDQQERLMSGLSTFGPGGSTVRGSI